MNWFTAAVLYVLIWWTVLFAVLPFGTRPVAEADDLTGWRGAPSRPLMGRKLIATTIVSTLLWAIALVIIRSSWFSFRAPSVLG